MASRNPFDLSHATYLLWVAFDQAMQAAKIDYVLTCTYRSEEEQQVLFDQGRNTLGKIVTNAPPGMSAHNCKNDDNQTPAARAFDIAVLTAGKPDWDGNNPAWGKAGEIGESVGLEWAGRWHSFPEKPHFQLPHWNKE